MRLLAWVAISVLATYLTFVGGGWLGIYTPEIRLVTMLGAAGLLLGWRIAARRSASWNPRTVLWPAIAAALASLAISTAFSRFPRVSLEYLLYGIVLAALYLLLVRLLAHPFFGRRLLTLAALFFAVIATVFVALVAVHWIDWWRILGRFALPPLRPNFEGLTYFNPSAVLTMVALFAVPAAALVDWGTRRGAALLIAILAVVAVVAFLSGSRAGWFAIALTVLATAVPVLLDRERRAAARAALTRAILTPRARAAAALVAAGVLVAGLAFGPGIIRRIGEGGEASRAQFAVTALRMFAESPVVGTGPGSWVIQRQAYTREDEPDVSIPHAHDVPVQTLAEQGLVGAAAGAVLLVLLVRLVREAMRDPDPLRRRFGWATLVGLLYFGFHQLLDFYANMPAALFAAAVPVAFLDATRPAATPEAHPEPAAPSSRRARFVARPGTAVVVLTALLATGGLVVQELPALSSARAAALADRGDWEAANVPARHAALTDPDIASYLMTAGLAAAHAGDHRAAAAYFERVAARDDLPEAWLNLAAEQVFTGDVAAARESLRAAARLGLRQPGVAMAVAGLALQLGNRDLAVDAIAAAIIANPTIIGDPWWDAYVGRRAALDAALHVVLLGPRSPAFRWQLALMQGDADDARRLVAADPDAAFGGLVIDAWSGNAAALAELLAACRAAPLVEEHLVWCARSAARAGDAAEAFAMRQLLEVLGPGLSGRAGLLRVAEGESRGAAGNLARFWGTFTYRRSTPQDLLVPSLLHLRLD